MEGLVIPSNNESKVTKVAPFRSTTSNGSHPKKRYHNIHQHQIDQNKSIKMDQGRTRVVVLEDPVDALAELGSDEGRLVLGAGALAVLGERGEELDGNINVGGINLPL